MRIIVGMNGTTGVIYGIRLLQVLSDIKGIETHLVISRACEKTIEIETDLKVEEIKAYATHIYPIDDIAACLASGGRVVSLTARAGQLEAFVLTVLADGHAGDTSGRATPPPVAVAPRGADEWERRAAAGDAG